MNVEFSPEAEKKFAEIVARYPQRDAALLPVLWLAQEEFGHLSPQVRKFVAQKLSVSPARVESVMSFYTLFTEKSAGRHHIQICRNLSCSLRRAPDLMECVEKELGIRPGERTADGQFSFSTVECLAACGGAPALAVNGEYHENMNLEKLRVLIENLRGQGGKDR